MVLFYELNTPDTITRTEDNTMLPVLPDNMTFDEKKAYYNNIGENFICIPYEMGSYVFNFNLSFDVSGKFTGLQPK